MTSRSSLRSRVFRHVVALAAAGIATPVLAAICAIPGNDGIQSASGIVNSYWTVPAGSYGPASGSITLSSRRGAAIDLAPGDLALVTQVQCADIDFSDTDAYGDGVAGDLDRGSPIASGYSDPAGSCLAGRHEFVRAGPGTSGATLDLSLDPLAGSYLQAAATATTGRRTMQVMRVPQYLDLTVTGTITSSPWNGASGGIVALDVARDLVFAGGDVDVDGLGFRGGGGRTRAQNDPVERYRWDLDTRHASKGEGIAGTPRFVSEKRDPDSGATAAITDLGAGFGGYPDGAGSAGDFARGAPGTAGGGGSYWNGSSDNGGGGGGGNGGAGGRGAAGWRSAGYAGINADYSNLPEKKWGFGGANFAAASVERLVFGGGGAAGDNNNNSPAENSSGAAGGGIILLRAGSISGTGTLSARGARAADNPGNDAAGAGGAGGSIAILSPDSASASLTANVQGGRGADSFVPGGVAHGPGGGGGGGVVVRNGVVTVLRDGGATGATTTDDNPPGGAAHGAEPGDIGLDLTIGLGADTPGQNAGFVCAVVDYGDAPDDGSPPSTGSYATLAASGGPNHFAVPGLRLGATAPDDDAGDQQDAAASADDSDGIDDEDGLSVGGSALDDTTFTLGAATTIRANLTGSGRLNLWIDLNRDGDFLDTVGGQAEHFVVDDDQTGSSGTRDVDYPITVPLTAVAGTSYVRARLCAGAGECSTPEGAADSGEVEDYRVLLQSPTPGGGICYTSFLDGTTAATDEAIWSFDDTLDDGSGNAHGPQNAPSVAFTTDDALGSGSAVTFSGAGVQYSDGSFLVDEFTDMSVGFWFRPTTLSPGTDQILYDEGGGTNGVAIALTTTGTVRYDVREGGGGNNVVVADHAVPADGAWHHVAFTYDDGLAIAYFDGVEVGQDATGFASLARHTSAGGFGANFGGTASSGGASSFSGDMDEAFAFREGVASATALANYYSCVQPLTRDYGDAPDTGAGTGAVNYLTRLADGGPSHLLAGDPSVFLGTAAPDAEDGTLQDDAAQADDLAGDDEDGVLRGGSAVADQTFTAGSTTDVEIVVNGAGFLNLWVDLNADGDFDDTVDGTDEYQLVDEDQSAGTGARTLTRGIVVPASAAAGDSYLRVRYCAAATDCDTPAGPAASGEVEDHRIRFAALDFGDAPDSGVGTGTGDYETLAAANGPSHGIVAGLFIGATAPDSDPGILRNADATADDTTDVADEGGLVTGEVLTVMATHSFDVPVTNTTAVDARLYAWIDFDQSGTFDLDESAGAPTLVTAGTNGVPQTLTFTVPADVVTGTTFVRLRLTTDTLASGAGPVDQASLGAASDGEVEDQTIDVLDLTFDYGDAPDDYDTRFASGGPRHGVDPGLRLGLSIDAEGDGVPDVLAESDDVTATADEDGVTSFLPLSASSTSYSVDVRVRNITGSNATLIGWIDFDGNRSFDVDEAVSQNVVTGTDGDVTLDWSGLGSTIDVVGGLTYARFRATTDPITAADFGGSVNDGEVEDYDLVIFGTEQCAVGPSTLLPITPFDFSGAVLEAGTDLQVGARYRFSDVTAGVDALVEITDAVNATLVELDDTGFGQDSAFQAVTNLISEPGEGYVEFVFTLVKTGTDRRLEPAPAFLASAIDVDGDGDDARELVEFFKPFGTVFREDPSLLTVTDNGSFFRFLPVDSTAQAGIDFSATESIATFSYQGTAEFSYRVGLTNADTASGDRFASLTFGCIEFTNPQSTTVDVDFGDAPAPYPTLLTDSGPLHTVDGAVRLGPTVDAEVEGQPDVGALGDDADGFDDEDAVTVGGTALDGQRFVPGQVFSLEVETVGAALLSAWIDWDGDGDWSGAGEKVIDEFASTGGSESFPITVPVSAAGGTTYARFRYTTDSGIDFVGGATDGEVEDYALVVARLDYGDAPDVGPGIGRDDYTTLEATGGPSHEVPAVPAVYLGAAAPDTDSGQLQALDALADDGDGADDEDGLTLAGNPLDDRSLARSLTHDVEVSITGGGFLGLWIDLNRDGDFDDTIAGVPEAVLVNDDRSANTGTNVVTVPVAIPAQAIVGESFVRARYCSTSGDCATPVGAAADGEVEDYRILIAPLVEDAVIAGRIFEDNGVGAGVAHDGLVNGDEAGLADLQVRLLFDDDGDGACDGSETVLAMDTTTGDGSYSLRPAQADAGRAACLVVQTPASFRSISEAAGGNPVLSVDPFDDFATLVVPGPGTVWNDVDFGDIRLPRLTPDRQDTVAPGASVSYLHFYDATTDSTVDFALGGLTENPPGLSWTDVLYLDANCSGELEGAEASDSLTGVALQAGDRVCLLVRSFAPADAPPDALHAREVTAATTFTGTGEGSAVLVTDITTVVTAQLRLVKQVRNIGPDIVDAGDDVDATPSTFNGGSPGDVLRYRITFRNEGALPVRTLVVSDNTPAFTALAATLACPSPLPAGLTGCTPETPDGVNSVGYQGAVRWRFDGALDTGAEGTVVFDVRIAQ